MAQHYKHADLSALSFGDIHKDKALYVVDVSPPLVVQSPALTLATPLVDDDGDLHKTVKLSIPKAFQEFVSKAEDAIKAHCLTKKKEYFKKTLNDAALQDCFKTFLDDSTLKAKVSKDLAVFDEDLCLSNPDLPVKSKVRAVFELSKICFGKTEFGAMWKVLQVQALESPKCLMTDFEGDDDDDDDDDSVHEFS